MKKYKKVINNKLKGTYGITDFVKKTITINKKRHSGKNHGNGIKKNKNGTASIIDTIVHEMTHAKHPKMSEKMVLKKTAQNLKKMTMQTKKKLYSKFK